MRADVLVGAQFGSEGKGLIAKHIANDYGMHIRVGGPNAGHTIYHEGREWKMRSVPCGWVNPNALLVIGAGALLDVDLLNKEIEALEVAGFSIVDRLYVDNKAAVITGFHREGEGGVDGDAHARIGSTGEGCGLVRMARINRNSLLPSQACMLYQQARHNPFVPGRIVDTVDLIHNFRGHALVEGTQGTGLSLIHGRWPYTTSADTTAMGILSDVGIPPSMVRGVILVARTYPIRVAGNSGPLPRETTFGAIGQPEERTTVTLKVRRIAKFDREQLRRSVLLNGATQIAITFMDYVDPAMRDMTVLTPGGNAWLHENLCATDRSLVTMLGTGPNTVMEVGA